jgi:hypothetical protein
MGVEAEWKKDGRQMEDGWTIDEERTAAHRQAVHGLAVVVTPATRTEPLGGGCGTIGGLVRPVRVCLLPSALIAIDRPTGSNTTSINVSKTRPSLS